MAGASGRIRVPGSILRVSPEGLSSDEVAHIAGFETYVFDRGDGTPPFQLVSFVAASDSVLLIGDGGDMEFRAYQLDGTLSRVVRILGFDLSVSEATRDSLRTAMLAQDLPELLRAPQDAMANSIPTRRPAYSGLAIDAAGFLWVAQYIASPALSSMPREWLVFSPDGEWLGGISLPPNFELYEAGVDYLLGRSRNALGVETVQMLRLTRP
jgi:hypothetical protein